MTAAMILGAGLGTRLRPLTDWRVKPLVPVGDREVLAHVLDRVLALSPSRVVVNTHHRPDDLRTYVEAIPNVAISHETELLGTAGGVSYARDLLGDGDVLVWNGDVMAAIDPRPLLATHAHFKCEATLAVRLCGRGEGNVGLDVDGRIVRLRQETVSSLGSETRGAEFLGVHLIGESLRADLPERGCLIGDFYLPAMRRGGVLQAFAWGGNSADEWFDIGSIDAYARANFAWRKKRRQDFWVGESAEVASGVRLQNALVGYGARITGEGSLTNAIVWPGTDVVMNGDRTDVILTPDGDVAIA